MGVPYFLGVPYFPWAGGFPARELVTNVVCRCTTEDDAER